MRIFQIKVLIQFWCSLYAHVSSLMGSSSGRQFVHAVLYAMFFMHLCKKSAYINTKTHAVRNIYM